MSSLQDPSVDLLLTRLDELVRWRPGARGHYQDLHSAVARLKGSANHIILGRRGSGKSRLLDELKRAVTNEDAIVVTIGAEDFKELTYPDILIQTLRSFLKEFQSILEVRPSLFSTGWWQDWSNRVSHPIYSVEQKRASSAIQAEVKNLLSKLDSMLAESEELDAEYVNAMESSTRQANSAEVSAKAPGSSAALTARQRFPASARTP